MLILRLLIIALAFCFSQIQTNDQNDQIFHDKNKQKIQAITSFKNTDSFKKILVHHQHKFNKTHNFHRTRNSFHTERFANISTEHIEKIHRLITYTSTEIAASHNKVDQLFSKSTVNLKDAIQKLISEKFRPREPMLLIDGPTDSWYNKKDALNKYDFLLPQKHESMLLGGGAAAVAASGGGMGAGAGIGGGAAAAAGSAGAWIGGLLWSGATTIATGTAAVASAPATLPALAVIIVTGVVVVVVKDILYDTPQEKSLAEIEVEAQSKKLAHEKSLQEAKQARNLAIRKAAEQKAHQAKVTQVAAMRAIVIEEKVQEAVTILRATDLAMSAPVVSFIVEAAASATCPAIGIGLGALYTIATISSMVDAAKKDLNPEDYETLFQQIWKATQKVRKFFNCEGELSPAEKAKRDAELKEQIIQGMKAGGLIVGAGTAVNCISSNTTNQPNAQSTSTQPSELQSLQDTQTAVNQLKTAGINISPGASVHTTYGHNGNQDAKVLTIQDAHGNRVKFLSIDGKAPVIIDEIMKNQTAYNAMLKYGPAKTETQIAQEQKVAAQLSDAMKKQDASQAQYDKKVADFDKNFNKIQKSLTAKGISSQEHLLPKNGVPGQSFHAAPTKSGRTVRDENGAYLDNKGNRWKFDTKKNSWDVTSLKGSRQIIPAAIPVATSPTSAPAVVPALTPTVTTANTQAEKATDSAEMSADEPPSPVHPGCGSINPLKNVPKILTSPTPDITKPENPGCGNFTPVETATDTAHTSTPEIDEVKGQPVGCPGMDATPEQTSTFYTWTDKNGIVRAKGDLRNVDVTFREDNKQHIFDNRPGHVIDTPKNRERITNLVKDPTKYLGPSSWGNSWYGEILEDGTQLWGEVRGDKILNCGLNEIPQPYNPETGLSAPKAPGNNNTK